MAVRIALNHQTSYRYDRPVTLGPQRIRLRPAPHCRTPIRSYSLKVSPDEHFENWQQDPQGNFLARYSFPSPTRELRVEVDLVAEMTTINPFDFFIDHGAETIPFRYEDWLRKELQPYLETETAGPRLTAFLKAIDQRAKPTVEFLVSLNQRLQREIEYLVRTEPGIQTCEETLDCGSGSCRDTCWLLVQTLRHLGLATRFVSGYLVQLVPSDSSLDVESEAEKDSVELHAWSEVYIPGAGWIGLDPTSGMLAGEGHIPLASRFQSRKRGADIGNRFAGGVRI